RRRRDDERETASHASGVRSQEREQSPKRAPPKRAQRWHARCPSRRVPHLVRELAHSARRPADSGTCAAEPGRSQERCGTRTSSTWSTRMSKYTRLRGPLLTALAALAAGAAGCSGGDK